MLLSTTVVAVLATRVLTAPFSGLASPDNVDSTHRSNIDSYEPAFTFSDYMNTNTDEKLAIIKDFAAFCALRICPPGFAPIIEDDECICAHYNVAVFEKRQDLEVDEARICAARVCPPRFGGVITNGTCGCVQLVGLRPTPSTVSTIQPTKKPTVIPVKRQEIGEDNSIAIRQEIVEDEAIICAVRVCPPRFGAIIIDGVCTCTRFGLPPPTPTPTPVKRSETAYGDCETPCESGYTGKLFGEYCRCVPPSKDDVFTKAITEREKVDNCFARTCPPRFFSAPDGKGGCNCVQGTKFAPPTA